MAERRMFACTVTDSDAFLDMPISSQALYFHLGMHADDEGFLNNAKKIQRMVGASEDDLKLLALKKFIILFDSGVVVIKHWRLNNYLQNDRVKPTIFQKEKSMLGIKINKAYTLNFDDPTTKPLIGIVKKEPKRIQSVSTTDTERIQNGYSSDTNCIHDQNGQNFNCEQSISEIRMNTDNSRMYTDCIQDVYSLDTQYSIDKINNNITKKEKDKKEKAKKAHAFSPPSVEEVREYCEERHNGIDPEAFVSFYASKGWVVGKAPMKDWKQAVITWEKRSKAEQEQAYKGPRNFINIPSVYSPAEISELENLYLEN